jgi:hypothetical protein
VAVERLRDQVVAQLVAAAVSERIAVVAVAIAEVSVVRLASVRMGPPTTLRLGSA